MAKKRTVCLCYGKKHQRLEAQASKLMASATEENVMLAIHAREAIRADIRKRREGVAANGAR